MPLSWCLVPRGSYPALRHGRAPVQGPAHLPQLPRSPCGQAGAGPADGCLLTRHTTGPETQAVQHVSADAHCPGNCSPKPRAPRAPAQSPHGNSAAGRGWAGPGQLIVNQLGRRPGPSLAFSGDVSQRNPWGLEPPRSKAGQRGSCPSSSPTAKCPVGGHPRPHPGRGPAGLAALGTRGPQWETEVRGCGPLV